MIGSIIAEQFVSLMLENASEQVNAYFARRREKRQLAELIDEYQMKSSGIQSNVNLPVKMNDPHLIEELLAHCILGDKTKDDAVAIFVGEDADRHARDFGKNLFDQMYMLVSKTGTSEAFPCQPGINRGLITEEKIMHRMDQMESHISDLSSPNINTQMALLQTVISSLESGSRDVSDLPALIEECNGSPAGKYLESYLALCRDDSRCTQLPGSFSERDQLIFPIVALAISSGHYEFALTALDLATFDSTQLKDALRSVFIYSSVPQERIEIVAPTNPNFESFATLLNAEMAYSYRACIAAEGLFSQLDGIMNPIARFHSAVSAIVSDALYGRETLFTHVKEAIGESRDWMPDMLLQQLADSLVMAYSVTDADWFERILENAPEHLQMPFENLRIILEISHADTFEEALIVMARAGQRRNTSAYLQATLKALTLDASRKGILAKEFLRNKDWLLASPTPFAFYVKELSTIHSYQEFQELGARINQTAEFHILAYDLFRNAEPEPSEKHMATALAMLREGTVNPLQALPEIWVPYLVENGRSQEVIDIASPYLPRESLETVKQFLAICRRVEETSVLLDRLVEVLANSDVFDTRIPEFLARYFASIGDVPTAGRLAMKAFKLHKTETTATIIANWCITSSLGLDEVVRDYIAGTDTQRTNLVGADVAYAEGNFTRSNQLLIRAAFREGDEAECALTAYAARNAGNTDTREYRAIEQDTCVTIEAEDGTVRRVFFFGEPDALVGAYASGPAGKAFLTKTPAYICVRGRLVGDMVTIGDTTGRITGIESAGAGLIRQGFKLIAKDPRTKVIRAEEGKDFLDQMAEAMQPQVNRLECYLSGLSIGGLTVFPGIETARRFGVPDKLEFTIEAIANEELPFRRNPYSRNSAIEDGETYLLSYSAAVCLALLKPPVEMLSNVSTRCSITESTARRLEQECQAILNDCFTSPGKFALVDGRPALFQNDEQVKQQWRDLVLCILNLVGAIQHIAPSTRVPTFEYAGVLCDNAAIDIQTAIDNGLAYVTEDCLEAQTIDAAGSLGRRSLTALLIGCQELRYLFADFCTTMQKWNAQPALEVDIVHALNAAIEEAFND